MKNTKDIDKLDEAQTLEAIMGVFKDIAIAKAHLDTDEKWRIRSIDIYLDNDSMNNGAKATINFDALAKRIDVEDLNQPIKLKLAEVASFFKVRLQDKIFQLATKIKE